MKLFDLSGKTALITGASSGLGTHFARCLGDAGASVVLAARRIDRLQSLQVELEDGTFAAKSIELDVQSANSVGKALDARGPSRHRREQCGHLDREACARHAREGLGCRRRHQPARRLAGGAGRGKRWAADKRPGSIVNIASILGLRTIGQVAPYNASKAGLIHLTRALAMEWARYGIRVNAICPGYIETEMNSDFWKLPAAGS